MDIQKTITLLVKQLQGAWAEISLPRYRTYDHYKCGLSTGTFDFRANPNPDWRGKYGWFVSLTIPDFRGRKYVIQLRRDSKSTLEVEKK